LPARRYTDEVTAPDATMKRTSALLLTGVSLAAQAGLPAFAPPRQPRDGAGFPAQAHA